MKNYLREKLIEKIKSKINFVQDEFYLIQKREPANEVEIAIRANQLTRLSSEYQTWSECLDLIDQIPDEPGMGIKN